jgi:hypothetical protein
MVAEFAIDPGNRLVKKPCAGQVAPSAERGTGLAAGTGARKGIRSVEDLETALCRIGSIWRTWCRRLC